MTTKRLLVTGSREFTDYGKIKSTLKQAYIDLSGYGVHKNTVILVTGNAKGADSMCEMVWNANVNPEWVERHKPKYDKYPQMEAPLVRNRYMVSLGADLCIAFPTRCKKTNCHKGHDRHLSHGTMYTVEKAVLAGIDTRIVPC